MDQWSPRHDVVDVAIAVDVLDRGARRAGDESRRAADTLEGADGAVDAARQDVRGAGEEFSGVGGFHRMRWVEEVGVRRSVLTQRFGRARVRAASSSHRPSGTNRRTLAPSNLRTLSP